MLQKLRTQNRLQLFLLALAILILYLIATVLGTPPFVYFVLTALALFAIILKHPEHGIYLILFGTFLFEKFFTQTPLVIGAQEYKIYFLDFIIIFTVISLLAKLLSGRIGRGAAHSQIGAPPITPPINRFSWTRLETFILLFILLNVFAFVRSFFVQTAHFELAFSTLKNYALYAMIYVLTLVIFNEKEKRSELMKVFLWAGASTLIFVFIGIARGSGLWAEAAPLSTTGARLIAGTHAFYILLAGIFAFLLSAAPHQPAGAPSQPAGAPSQPAGARPAGARQARPAEKSLEAMIWLSAIALAVSLVRHLWLAFFITGIFMFWYAGWQVRAAAVKTIGRLVFLFAGISFIAVLIFASFDAVPLSVSRAYQGVKERLDFSLWQQGSSDTSVNYRYALWDSALKLFFAHPIFGAGTGLLLESEIDGFFFAAPARDIHNNYLGILSQLGLVGAIVISIWFLDMARAAVAARRIAQKDPVKLWAVWSIGLFMVIFAFSVYWDSNVFVTLWWFSLAVFRLEIYDSNEKRGF